MSQKPPSYKDLEIVKNEYLDKDFSIKIEIPGIEGISITRAKFAQYTPEYRNQFQFNITNGFIADLNMKMGYKNIFTIPLAVDFNKYNIIPDPDILNRYSNDGWSNWLFVGRISPNKKQEDLIKIFYYYQ